MLDKKQKGIILVSIMILSAVLLLLGTSLVVLTLTDRKIAKAQDWAVDAYYLAESGVAETIWKLKNDSEWLADFEDGGDWSQDPVSREAVFSNNTFYEITINPLDGPAHAEIIILGKVDIGGDKFAKRIIKTKVFKATAELFPDNIAVYAEGDIKISGTDFNITGGEIFMGNDIKASWWGDILSNQNIKAIDDINASWWSTIITDSESGIYANECDEDWDSTIFPECTLTSPETVEMPSIDFDESIISYKNRADNIYSDAEFRDMLNSAPDKHLIINGITYITGPVQIKKEQTLTVNGILIADDNIKIGTGGSGNSGAELIVNNTPGQPSGLLTKKTFSIHSKAGDIDINGLIYALVKITISKPWYSTTGNININGGILTKNFDISSNWKIINLNHNSSIIQDALGQSEFSPVVTVEHWEEEY
ncbi:hypothetical protein CL633_01925 [bacterium]|nr:hypothetical protein [bacterium]